MAQYGNAELVWCQEEPKNMGAWSYIKPRLDTAMRELGPTAGMHQRPLRYVGRTAAASVGEIAPLQQGCLPRERIVVAHAGLDMCMLSCDLDQEPVHLLLSWRLQYFVVMFECAPVQLRPPSPSTDWRLSRSWTA